MAKFLSGRQKNLTLGVESFSEDKVSLEVIGKVGINSSNPTGTLDVVGDVNVLGSLGISTLSTDNLALGVGASITIAGIAGSDGQYLGSTGAGITWANFPNLRTGLSTVGILSQTTIQTIYNIDFLDVFVNGVLLDSTEYTAANGIDIIFNEPFLGGENIDIFSYNTVSAYGGGGGGTTVVIEGEGESLWVSNVSGIYTNANVGIFTDTPQSALDVNGNINIFGDINSSGIITAANFVGDGSGLSNVIGTGSGVVILDSGNLVGTASTIDFGNNLSISAISAGILTVSSPDIPPSYWVSGSSGIGTASNVGIGTTITTSTLTVDGTLSVSGISTFENNVYLKDDNTITFGTDNDFSIFHNVNTAGQFQANSNYIHSKNSRDLYIFGSDLTSLRIQNSDTLGNVARFEYGGPVELYHQSVKKFETTEYGILVSGGINASGVTTSTSFSGSGTNLTGIVTSIVAGTNVTISGSTGQVTINASGSGGGGGESYWTQYSTGISTTSNVGIGTTNAISKLTVDGDGYFTGIITANQFTTQTGGTPTIDSPNNLNINANVVAISTDVTVGRHLTVSGDAIVGVNTSSGVILTSPNGTQYRLIVDNSGNLSTTAV